MVQTTEKEFAGGKFGGKLPFFLIAGPCVIESDELLNTVATQLKQLSEKHNLVIYFKSSFDKANRSSINSFRGPGLEAGLEQLARIKQEFGMPVLTDIHEPAQAEAAAQVADMLQIPAFLCRQTDLIVAAAKTDKWVNIKKGQFVAPTDVMRIVEKFQSAGSEKVTICERGYTFGYNNLVVDMRGIEQMRAQGIHVVFDATHSTQLPGGGEVSGGQREMAFPLARAAAAVGVDGFFTEVHPDPASAKSDATNQLPLDTLGPMIETLLSLDAIAKGRS